MEILFEDQDIIVVRKEAGIPVQGARASQMDLIAMIKNHLRQEEKTPVPSGKLSSAEKRAQKTGEPYLGIVHRLDQPVEGILVFAKNNKAAGELSRQVRAKENGFSDMRKVYQAVVLVSDRKGEALARRALHSVVTLQNDLKRDYRNNTSLVVPEGTRDSKRAELTFRTLEIADDGAGKKRALLEVHLHTGRHHQIRVQLSHAGLPIEGDRKYGPKQEGYMGPLKLCACSLQIRHPSTGKKMAFSMTPSFPEEEGLFSPERSQPDPGQGEQDPPSLCFSQSIPAGPWPGASPVARNL